ncbi:PRC-barrel domain-containing protein [cf. Phormidesmis sp. LEGE 11477]|uniref:PRC-barrel domain-containing protein n=1 Tax=cf. Phormidesmis sp. LEGE 11477 TaxID=1828680 RepID=UPI001880FB96|nr:PRC-barrel domain-containing protein [cf. Phormidesmis sp. LEGE 11477]MBE9061942.1 PRC-barrel domain-containing protein [cf. Phormidesmis sp. LEGE 11477]
MEAAIIRQGELVGRGMMAYETTEEVGVVEHLLVNVQQAKVVGLTYKTPHKALGLIGRRQHLDWAQLVKIGKDRIVVQSEIREAVESRLSAAQDMTNLEVWTDGGDLIGRVVDICFDQGSGQVEQYLFALKVEEDAAEAEAAKKATAKPADETATLDLETADDEAIGEDDESLSSVAASVYAIEPRTIISAGRKRMMIAEEDAARSQPYHQLLTLPPKQAAEPLKSNWKPEQLPEIPTDFGELLQKGQSLAGQVGERVREQAKRFTEGSESERENREELPEITEQLQEKTAQMKQQLQRAQERVREQARTQIGNRGLEKKLGKTAFGRALGKTFDKLNPQSADLAGDPIDVESFEVWEEDETSSGDT